MTKKGEKEKETNKKKSVEILEISEKETNKKKSVEILEISEKELADYFGVSDRRIRQLAKEEIAIKTKPGNYDLKKSVQNYINFIKTEDDKTIETKGLLEIELQKEKLQHERLKRKKTEMLIHQMQRKLLRVEDVEYIWNKIAVAIKTRISAIPTKAAPILVDVKNVNEVKEILSKQIDDVLIEISMHNINDYEAEMTEMEEELEDNE